MGRVPQLGALVLSFSAIAFGASLATAQGVPQSSKSTEQIQRYAVPQSAPCEDQPGSLKDLASSFEQGRRPLASDMTGTWVAVGMFREAPDESRSTNCSGVRRGSKFEFVFVADGYSIELHAIAMAGAQTVRMRPDGQGSVQFREVDFGGERNLDNYRCRLTSRGTLACLLEMYAGVEFKKTSVEKDKIYTTPDGL